jgi:iron-sulfur cluster assembly accessory protein
MITLTDRAADRLKTLVDERNTPGLAPEEKRWAGLRLFVQGGGCAGLQYGMTFEHTAREGDTVVEAQGVRLYVDPISATYLKGASIDHEDSLGGSSFRVDNPNAVAVCACGSSFRIEGGRLDSSPCQE